MSGHSSGRACGNTDPNDQGDKTMRGKRKTCRQTDRGRKEKDHCAPIYAFAHAKESLPVRYSWRGKQLHDCEGRQSAIKKERWATIRRTTSPAENAYQVTKVIIVEGPRKTTYKSGEITSEEEGDINVDPTESQKTRGQH